MRFEVLAGRRLSQPIGVGRSRNQHNITSVGLKACCKGKSSRPIVLADCARYFGPMRADCQSSCSPRHAAEDNGSSRCDHLASAQQIAQRFELKRDQHIGTLFGILLRQEKRDLILVVLVRELTKIERIVEYFELAVQRLMQTLRDRASGNAGRRQGISEATDYEYARRLVVAGKTGPRPQRRQQDANKDDKMRQGSPRRSDACQWICPLVLTPRRARPACKRRA